MAAIDSSKPCVAFLIDRWEPERGGGERMLAQFAEHLIARGHRVVAVAEQHAEGAPGEFIRTRSSGMTRSRQERDRARRLVKAARNAGAQVLVGCRHLYECDLYWPHGGAHAATMRQVRLSRGEDPDAELGGRHETFLELGRELCERGGARRIACVSPMVLDELAHAWPKCRERLVLVENGVDLERFRPDERETLGTELRAELGVPRERALLLFVARNPELKGWKELGQALEILLERGERAWTLLAVVPDDARKLRLDAEHLVRRERVDPRASYLAADLCLAPTWRDTSGLVILEALASGTPVVTTRFAGAASVVDASSGDVIDSPSNVEALADAIARQLVRVRSGTIERSALRARVASRDLKRCHETLERLVLEVARSSTRAN